MTRLGTLGAVVLFVSACSPEVTVAPEPASESAAYVVTAAASGPAACVQDSKLIGRIELSSADAPGTWWRLTREGFDEAGITDYLSAIEGFFGMQFATLEEAAGFLVDQVTSLDANENGYVCAYRVRGTRASFGDPNFAFYVFYIRDDKHFAP